LFARRDVDRAIADFDEVIRRTPEDAEAYYNRGLAWLAKGDKGRAFADFWSGAQLGHQDARAAVETFGGKPP
jgi:hypothetical protein